MLILDNLFKETFLVSENMEVIERDYTYHFKNVFKDVNAVLDFESKLSKWYSDDGAKPGFNTLKLPKWTAHHIAHQMIPEHISIMSKDDVMHDDYSSVEFNYFYYNNRGWNKENKSLVSNNCLLPHTDPTFDFDSYIILFNLNKRPVSTCFWLYDGKRRVDSPDEDMEISQYEQSITYDNLNDKLSEGLLKKQFCIEYNFNDAIMYNANRLHSPVIDTYWTKENPRCILRCVIKDYNY